ncbi:hypothetical protein [Gorillibacterium sp. sgz5001074]|uniref:hypothetical protein n=1 Tax=Gorillibacterium sp. sgz5001074 TaxID=3446695 RepID=UPI003F664AE4
MDGWICLHRKIRGNPIFNNLELFRLWLICLTEATHREHDQLVGQQMVKLMPGQFVTGRFDLEKMYNDGLPKDQERSGLTIWRWLQKLEKYEFLNINSNNKFTVVSILNWDKYQNPEQQNEQQLNNKRTTTEQEVNTNNNGNNDNNELKDIFDFWNSQGIIVHRELTQKVKGKINARLKKSTVEEIKETISNYKTIVVSELYWYTHKFTLEKFMDPKNLEQFMTSNNPFENFRKQRGGGNGAKHGTSTQGIQSGRNAAQSGTIQNQQWDELYYGSPQVPKVQ